MPADPTTPTSSAASGVPRRPGSLAVQDRLVGRGATSLPHNHLLLDSTSPGVHSFPGLERVLYGLRTR
jgi:hypothetical protein